jgi:hypothetical protein
MAGTGGSAVGGRGGAGGRGGTGGSSTAGSGGASGTCKSLMASTNSGNIGTDAVCYEIDAPVAGWQVSNLQSRTLTINGMPAGTPPALPAAMGGTYVFAFSAGEPAFTAWSYWR